MSIIFQLKQHTIFQMDRPTHFNPHSLPPPYPTTKPPTYPLHKPPIYPVNKPSTYPVNKPSTYPVNKPVQPPTHIPADKPPNKLSLKSLGNSDHSITSTTTATTKKSIKNLLANTRAGRQVANTRTGRQVAIQHWVSLRYTDIQEKVESRQVEQSFLHNLLCRVGAKEKEEEEEESQDVGCRCEPRCLWMDHWRRLTTMHSNSPNVSNSQSTNKGRNGETNGGRSGEKSANGGRNRDCNTISHISPNTRTVNRRKIQIGDNEKMPSSTLPSHASICTSRTSSEHTLPSQIEECLTQIKKDMHRTQPNHPTFQDPAYLDLLYQTLVSYAMADPRLGYIQGFNIIASVLVYHTTSLSLQHNTTPPCTFIIFKFIMMEMKYRELYLDQFRLGHRLTKAVMDTLRTKCHDLYQHCDDLQVDLRMFVLGWLIPLLGNIVPLRLMHLVINVYLDKQWEGVLGIVVGLLLYLREAVLEMEEDMLVMEALSVQGLLRMGDRLDWQEIILSSRNVKVALL